MDKNRKLLILVKYVCLNLLPVFIVIPGTIVHAQKKDAAAIRQMVDAYKKDPRGPYRDIRWFCKDGTTRPPKERCPEPGLQRARYKDEVLALSNSNHIFLGQILATTPFEDFWDKNFHNSRLKQYLLEEYLKRNDNGWLLRKAQFYRGSVQAEDEENWGLEFFRWLLNDRQNIDRHFFLIRESARTVPHQGDDNKTQKIRALSKEISDSIPAFMDIRVKIHGHPEATDVQDVRSFYNRNKGTMPQNQARAMEELIRTMELHYKPVDPSTLLRFQIKLDANSPYGTAVKTLVQDYPTLTTPQKVSRLADLIHQGRTALLSSAGMNARLAILDISLKSEEILFREIQSWQPAELDELLLQINLLAKAAAGCGYIEFWEYDEIKLSLAVPTESELEIRNLYSRFLASRRLVEWCAGMYRGVFKDVVELYSPFEPQASGFIDDRIRGTLLLPLGDRVGKLGQFVGEKANLTNHLMNLPEQSQVRGLNPGIAVGELVVVDKIDADLSIQGNKIYVFNQPPADLKPVAGIATVSEGNMVSHVQLLARNLAIPNAVITATIFEELKSFQGNRMFYAVTDKGTVILKKADQMTKEEKQLFEKKERTDERILVPTDKLQLESRRLYNLREINARHSGALCGPKAANLGQLKMLFPGHVVEGLVIPFGIFRAHLDQGMPGRDMTYWEFLMSIFDEAAEMENHGDSPEIIESRILENLAVLRESIRTIPLLPSFKQEIFLAFNEVFGKPMGSIPVFLRSDTNMEDLKDFTGAGLNLTLFNVLDEDKILDGIKDVWASPYSERSYKWRQRFLLNPQQVFPSILIIPTVPVDRSGVVITKGILTGASDESTIAFSRGAGGAVEGQSAETWISGPSGNTLLSPSREPFYTLLPSNGGIKKEAATFEEPVLNVSHLKTLDEMVVEIRRKMRTDPNQLQDGAWDVELGFTGPTLWLFQIRPFVENKNAGKMEYLSKLAPDIPEGRSLSLKTKLD